MSYQLDHSITSVKQKDSTIRNITKAILFEEIFYWPKTKYINPSENHLAYNKMVDSNYHYQSNLLYEIQWEVITAEISKENKNCLLLSNKETTHYVAIPPIAEGKTRYDYITDNNDYYYDCKQGEHEGIEIIVDSKKNLISLFSIL